MSIKNFLAQRNVTAAFPSTLPDNTVQVSAAPSLDYNTFGLYWTALSDATNRNWAGVACSANGQYITGVVTGGSIYYSNNNAVTMTASASAGTTAANWSAVAMSASGQYQIATINSGSIYYSSNYGQTWTIASGTAGSAWSAVAMSASGTYATAVVNGGQIWYSTNYGQTWTAIPTSAGPSSITLAWSAIAISASGQYQVAVINGGSVYYSSTFGFSWTASTTSGTTAVAWTAVAISASGQYVTAGISSAALWTSTTYGQTWTVTSLTGFLWKAIVMVSSAQYQLAVGTSSMYYSNNFGSTWTTTGSSYTIRCLAASTAGHYLFAGVYGGVVYQSVIRVPSIFSSGSIIANGVITGNSITSSGTVSGAILTSSGAVSGATVTASGAVSGATVTASGAVSGATVTASGAISGSTLSVINNTSTGSLTSIPTTYPVANIKIDTNTTIFVVMIPYPASFVVGAVVQIYNFNTLPAFNRQYTITSVGSNLFYANYTSGLTVGDRYYTSTARAYISDGTGSVSCWTLSSQMSASLANLTATGTTTITGNTGVTGTFEVTGSLSQTGGAQSFALGAYGSPGDYIVPTTNFYGSTVSDGGNMVNIQCQASQFGRNILYLTGRYEGGNDTFSFNAPRNAIIFRTQASLNSSATNRYTIQNFADQLGIMSAGKGGTPITKWSNDGTLTHTDNMSIGGVVTFTKTGDGVILLANTATIQVKNSAGTYEQFLWPRFYDNITYLNYGSGGFNIRNNAGTSTMFLTNEGSVAIGTITPISVFTLYQASNPCITIGNSNSTSVIQIGAASTAGSFSTSAAPADAVIRSMSGNLILQTGSASSAIYINTSNFVGINITTPSYTLHVSGAIYASGDITALSDQRHKQNITPLTDSLAAITQLSGYSYTRSDYKPGEKQIGLIAQEVKEVYPEAVSYDDVNDTYSLNYGCLMAPVIQAIKEMKDRIERQDLIIQQLLDSLSLQ